ncbi:MAG: hypothetical protein ACFFCS_05785 [Candidatus Hodarchaeota archaeon]
MVDLVNTSAYHLQKYESEYDMISMEGNPDIYVLKKVVRGLPSKFTVECYGWGPFKHLVLRR